MSKIYWYVSFSTENVIQVTNCNCFSRMTRKLHGYTGSFTAKRLNSAHGVLVDSPIFDYLDEKDV